MNDERAEKHICQVHCNYYKPNRKDEERCRGFELASLLLSEKALPTSSTVGPFDPSYKRSFIRKILCEQCPFFVDGCDFVSDDGPPGATPCGGLVLISSLLKNAAIQESDLQMAREKLENPNVALSLSLDCSLKRLEKYYVYHISHDDLYEVNEDGFRFLESCEVGQRSTVHEPDPGFIRYCIDEGLLVQKEPVFRSRGVWPELAPVPSLRYLEWLVTQKCNLTCAHCYLGESVDVEFPRELIESLLSQFSAMQGLRVLVSGGEPTVYRHFLFLNDIIDKYPLRFVLLTNGITLTASLAKRLKFHEVQVSLDGMRKGHEVIRGQGTFSRVLKAMENVKSAGLDLSVASMVHRENLSEWDEMQALVERYGVKEWNIDYPCTRGRWELHPDLFVEQSRAAQCMKYGFGGSYHGTDQGWTCGRHLAAVLPSGEVCRCALYSDVVVGHVKTGLREAWQRVEHIPISDTSCRGCIHSDECGGGCRYRAGDLHAKDAVMCALFSTDSP